MGTEEKERYYRVINSVWDFMKTHLGAEQDWATFCADMAQTVFSAPAADQKLLRAMLVAFENDLVDRSESNG